MCRGQPPAAVDDDVAGLNHVVGVQREICGARDHGDRLKLDVSDRGQRAQIPDVLARITGIRGEFAHWRGPWSGCGLLDRGVLPDRRGQRGQIGALAPRHQAAPPAINSNASL